MNKHNQRKNSVDKHHLLPKAEWWTNDPRNLVEMRRSNHEWYHKLFGTKGIIEALRELFWMWAKCIEDWKYKDQLIEALAMIDYKKWIKKD